MNLSPAGKGADPSWSRTCAGVSAQGSGLGPGLQEGWLLVQDGLEVCGQSWVGRCLQDGQCGRWELSAQLCLGCRGTEVSVHNPEDTRGHASRCLQATEGKAGRPSEACCVGAQRPA